MHAGGCGKPKPVFLTTGSPNHILSADDLSPDTVDEIHKLATDYETGRIRPHRFTGKSVALLFFQPSTRTRMGFEAAAAALGHQTVGATDMSSSRSNERSAETLEDCAAVVSRLCDAIVVRHHEVGAAARMAAASECPLINAGDGWGEHPTQALVDICSMRRDLGTLKGRAVAFCGDPRGRTVRSLVKLLRLEGVRKVVFNPPPTVPIPDDVVKCLVNGGIETFVVPEIATLLRDHDAVVMNPFDMSDVGEKAASGYVSPRSTPDTHKLTKRLLDDSSCRALVYHPMPRLDEIDPDCDASPAARYLEQVRISKFVRMAVLHKWMAR